MLRIVASLLGHAADSPTLSHFPLSSVPDREEPVLTEPVQHVVQDGGSEERDIVSNQEHDILQQLSLGQGITPYEEIGLIEKCGNCNRLFVGSSLRAHIGVCCEGLGAEH